MRVSPSRGEGNRGGMMAIDGERAREIRLKEMSDWLRGRKELVIDKSRLPKAWLEFLNASSGGYTYDALVYATRMK